MLRLLEKEFDRLTPVFSWSRRVGFFDLEMKNILLFIVIACLAVSFTSRPFVAAVFESDRVSFVESGPAVLEPSLEIVFDQPTKDIFWFERLEERGVARCSAGYFVTSYERPPPIAVG